MPDDHRDLIVFTDIVGFSKYDGYKQKNIITSLNAELSRELFPYLRGIGSAPSMICLPTGDGMALVFAGGCDGKVLLSLIHCVINWTNVVTKQQGLDPACEIRVGVHAGAVSIITDLNRLPNICGDDINTCRRIMDQARSNQVLFSESAYDKYIRPDEAVTSFPFTSKNPAKFSERMSVTAKHNRLFQVRVMSQKGKEVKWNNGPPMSVPVVYDGPDAAAERTALINTLLLNLAEGSQEEVTIYEQATFSTFSITKETEAGNDSTLMGLYMAQRSLLEKLMRKKSTTLKVIIRPVLPAPKNEPHFHSRYRALAAWMDANLDGDTFRPADGATAASAKSTVQFREALGKETEVWKSGGPNLFMVSGLVRIDGYRLRNKKLGHGLSLVYYDDPKIREAMGEFENGLDSEKGQTNSNLRKRLEAFLPAPERSGSKTKGRRPDGKGR